MIRLTERKAAIQPIRSRLSIRILEDDDLTRINETARDILEEVGVLFPSTKALGILREAGAEVDDARGIVKIPSQLVDDCLSRIPRQYILAGRRPELDVRLGEGRGTYFYCSGTAPNIVDFETGTKRRAVKSDIAEMARIADYLPLASVLWPTVSAGDKGETAPVHEVEACFSNTEKHVQTESVMDEVSAEYTIEMASIIAGGTQELRARPIFSLLLCGVAPLSHHGRGVESALKFAEAGLPVGFMSMPTMGLTAPPYQAADLAIGLAEVLAGCVLLQTAFPGTPLFISIQPALIDPRSGDYFYGSPVSQITSAAAVQLAHSNNLPINSQFSFGGNASELNRWQVGLENVYGHLLSVMAGADMAYGPSGLLEAVSLLDMARILFDNEIFRAIDIVTNGIQVDDRTLAFDMIRKVGPRGSFLGHRRTADELPKLWPQSILLERSKEIGRKYRDPVDVAHEMIRWIRENHHPEPLDEKTRQELQRIVAQADQDERLKQAIRGSR